MQPQPAPSIALAAATQVRAGCAVLLLCCAPLQRSVCRQTPFNRSHALILMQPQPASTFALAAATQVQASCVLQPLCTCLNVGAPIKHY